MTPACTTQPQNHHLIHQGVSNDDFVAGLTGLIPSRLPWSHIL